MMLCDAVRVTVEDAELRLAECACAGTSDRAKRRQRVWWCDGGVRGIRVTLQKS